MRALLLLSALASSACSPLVAKGIDAGLGDAGGPVGATVLPDGGMATWYRDVLPVAQTRCQGCHNTGGIAPFSMDSYASVKSWSVQMAADVVSRKMPPWMASDTCGMSYVDSRRMSQTEIDVFTAWVANHAAEGNPADAPAAVQPQTLPWVDTTIAPVASYTPDANGTDDYHCFMLDLNLASAQSVIGYDIAPGQRAEVHHVILFAVDKAAAITADQLEGGEGWTCFGGPDVKGEVEMIGGWAPGTSLVQYPAGTGIPIAPGKVLAMQIHYNTRSGVRTADSTTVKLQYAKTAVTPAQLIGIGDETFSIPPNKMGYTPVTHPKKFPNTLGYDAKAWGVLPHMHTKGKRITVIGPTGCYVDVPQWDFHWQQQYFFSTPQVVKQNEIVTLSCTWDNPTTGYVTFGETTEDEMCLAFFYATKAQ